MTRHIENIGVTGKCDDCGKHREIKPYMINVRYPMFGDIRVERRHLCKKCASGSVMCSLSDLHEQLGRQL